ncbi:hypothetical protein ACOME3_006679, partial [Neoechinorhynchus agilis]
ITSYFKRARMISSESRDWIEEKQRITKVLRSRGLPEWAIKIGIKTATHIGHRKKKETTSISIKYIGFHHISDTATRKPRRLKYLAPNLLIYNKWAHPLRVFSREKPNKRPNQGSTKFHVRNNFARDQETDLAA